MITQVVNGGTEPRPLKSFELNQVIFFNDVGSFQIVSKSTGVLCGLKVH
jgi:hypothetical protein